MRDRPRRWSKEQIEATPEMTKALKEARNKVLIYDKDINVGKVAEKTNEEKAVEERSAVISKWLKSVKEYL